MLQQPRALGFHPLLAPCWWCRHSTRTWGPKPQKTPQLGVGAGKGPTWMCSHLLAGLPVGFGDSHRLLCSLSRARHARALSHPAPCVGFCPDISFSGGLWAFTAGAVMLWHMEGGSSAWTLAAHRYKRYRCGKPPAAPSTSGVPQLCSRTWGALGTHGAGSSRLFAGSIPKPIRCPPA